MICDKIFLDNNIEGNIFIMRKKGFTLIELLAVIIILAILMIIAVPNILSTLATARERAFVTQAQSIYKTAEQQYLKDSMLGINNVCYDTSNLDLNSISSSITFQVAIDSNIGKISSITVTDSGQHFTASGTEMNNINMVSYNPSSLDCVGYSGVNRWNGSVEEVTPSTNNENIFVVNTPEQLAWVSEQVNSGTDSFEGKTILLGANLDMGAKFNSDGTLKTGSAGAFTPIGVDGNHKFKGNFDGQNHKIYNLYVKTTSDKAGLIGITEGTFFKNVTVENSYFESNDYAGIIAQHVVDGRITIDNVQSINNIVKTSNGSYIGGIIGILINGDLTNCVNTSKIFGKIAGGIVGHFQRGNLRNNRNTGTIDCNNNDNCGGIAGFLAENANSGNFEVINNNNSGNVINANGNAGGIVGQIIGSSNVNINVNNNTNSGTITVSNSYAGGMAGYSVCVSYENNTNSGTITVSNDYAGGIAGYATSGSVFENNTNTGTITVSNNYAGGIAGYATNGPFENNTNTGTITANNSNAGGITGYSINGPYENNTNSGNITATLNNAGGIAGYAINRPYESNTNNGNISSTSYAGGILGFSIDNVIENNTNNGNVTTSSLSAGGIVGSITVSQVINNVNNGVIIGETKWIGGIIGIVDVISSNTLRVISGNTNNGEVKTTRGAFRVGGIIGNANERVVIYNNINNGDVDGVGNGTANSYGTGGIVGTVGNEENDKSYLYNNYNKGNVKGYNGVGGIVGNVYDESISCECVVNSINEGEIRTTAGYAGGIIGIYNTNNEGYVSDFVTKAYNSGTVKGVNAAGLVGANIGIKNSISVGTLQGNNNFGVIGNYHNGVNITNVYFPNTYTSSYGTNIDINNISSTTLENTLGNGFSFTNGVKLKKAIIELEDSEITSVTYSNELLN